MRKQANGNETEDKTNQIRKDENKGNDLYARNNDATRKRD